MSAAKSKACAPLRAVAGGVSLASANLWPVYVGIKKGYIADVDIKIDLNDLSHESIVNRIRSMIRR